MNIKNIREKLHNYIDTVDDKKVKGLYLFVEDDIVIAETPDITPDQKTILDKRMEDHLSGKDKSYTFKQAHASIRRKRKTA